MGKIFVCEKGEGKWESYILLIINQLENDSRIITLSKYKDCSYSLLFACNSKPIPIEATLHKEMNSTKRKTLRVFPYFVALECLFYLKKKKVVFLGCSANFQPGTSRINKGKETFLFET